MEKCLNFFYYFGKINDLRREIMEFALGNDNFSEAWEIFLAFTKRCPHHGVPSRALVHAFSWILRIMSEIW